MRADLDRQDVSPTLRIPCPPWPQAVEEDEPKEDGHDSLQNRHITMSLFGLSTWLVGAANGYAEKQGGLPSPTVYGTLGVTSIVGTMNVISKSVPATTPSLALFLMSPLVVGALYYVGNQVGSSVRLVSDSSGKTN